MTVVVLSSTRELLGTMLGPMTVLPPSPFGHIRKAFEPAFATVSVSVVPAARLRTAALVSVKFASAGAVVLLFGLMDDVCDAMVPPGVELNVTVMLRAPLPPLRESHRRTGMVPVGMVSGPRSAGVMMKSSLPAPATLSLESVAVVG